MQTYNAPNMTLGDKYVSRINYRLNRLNKNWIGAICGPTGSGKSYAGLTLAYRISYGRFHTVFSPLQFMQALNNPDLEKGDMILFDEAGVGLSSRDWYSVQNKLLGSVLQTFRNKNVGVIFTTPNLSFIDVQARKLFHAYFETRFIHYDRKLAVIKPFDIQVNSRLDKIFYKKPQMKTDRGLRKIEYLAVEMPPDKIVRAYESAKTAYTEALNKKTQAELERAEAPIVKRPVGRPRIQPTISV